MNALELIKTAYALAGVVSQDYEEINQSQLAQGIYWLNVVTSEKKIRSGAIPFRKSTGNDFTLSYGVETYVIPDLVSLDSLAFTDPNANNLRYSIHPATYQEYFSSGRANNTISLPAIYYPERKDFGMEISFFPFPNKEYVLNIRGKFGLTSRTIATLTVEYQLDEFFLGLITYQLAKKLCLANDEVWTAEKELELNKINNKVFGMVGIDMSKKFGSGFLSTNANVENMLKGWMP